MVNLLNALLEQLTGRGVVWPIKGPTEGVREGRQRTIQEPNVPQRGRSPSRPQGGEGQGKALWERRNRGPQKSHPRVARKWNDQVRERNSWGESNVFRKVRRNARDVDCRQRRDLRERLNHNRARSEVATSRSHTKTNPQRGLRD